MRTILLACALALAACGKPAEDKKTEKRDTPAPSPPPGPPAPTQVQLPPPAPEPAPGTPLTAEEKAKEVTKLEAKIGLVDEHAAKLTEDMKTAATEAEREQLVKKLEHLVAEKAELKQQLETLAP